MYISPKLAEEVFLDSIVASAMLEQSLGTPAQIRTACLYLIEQEDEHDGCTLTACLNPLHPGPCKGWKHTLHQVSPEAWHALEAARVEKANKKRIAKIEELKAKNLPIPKKLLVEIKPKPAPTGQMASEVGKTAAKAGGEAHAAGKAVSEAAGIVPKHAGLPGKVTLGQAVKAPLGPKGKKPTLASKGIAFVISQEKVTDAYKLDKASKITPEQWANLSHADQEIVYAELKKIQENGFGPQKDKATELLGKLPVGAHPAPEAKHVTTPSGQKIQDVTPPKTPELAKTGGPAAKALPTPGYRKPEPTKLSEVSTPKTAIKAELPGGKKTGTLTDQVLNPEKYYNDKQQGALKSLDAASADEKLTALKMSASDFHNLNTEDQNKILAELDKLATTHPDPAKAAQAQLLVDAYRGDAAKLPKSSLMAIAVASHTVGQNADILQRVKALNAISGEEYQQLKKTYRDAITAEHQALLKKLPLSPELADLGVKIKGAGPAVGDHPLLGKHVTGKSVLPGGKQVSGVLVHHSTKTDTVGPMKGEKVTIAHIKADNGQVHMVKPESIHEAGTEQALKVEGLKAAEKAVEQPKHVQDAVAMSKGQMPGASWAKNQLPVYQKLSKQEFDSLPPETRSKIMSDLEKGLGKFLDPKKKLAAQETIDKLKGATAKAEVKPEAPKIENVSVAQHLHSYDVSPAQAKKAVNEATPAELRAVVHATTNLPIASHPDDAHHEKLANDQAVSAVSHVLLGTSDKALADPNVQAAIKSYRQAVHDQHYAQSVAKAKKDTFNAISSKLAGDKGELTPIQRAALEYQYLHVTNHPVDTSEPHLTALHSDTANKFLAVENAIEKADAGKPDAKVSDLSPAQITSKVSDLIGHEATTPNVNLSLAEMKYAHDIADQKYATHAATVPEDLAGHPQVAQALSSLKYAQRNLAQNEAMRGKLQSHLDTYHNKTLSSGFDKNGNPLSEQDRAVIEAHAQQLKNNVKHLDTYQQQYEKALSDRINGLNKAISNAQEQAASVKAQASGGHLSEFDTQTISDAYTKGWKNAAYDVVFYGAKNNWSKKQTLKSHVGFDSFNQDYKDLGAQAGALAVAHGHAHQALLAVPTDEDGHPLTDTPEWKAYQDASKAAKDAQAQFDAKLKTAQAKLDTIREAAGLKKRSLPKIDAAAVKTSAAESGFYKSGSYGGPNYGKNASAKQYMMAKVGPKLAVPHKDYGDKYEEKSQKAAEKQAKLAEEHKAFYEAQAASKEANKGKYALPAHLATTQNQQIPNKAVADHFGFHLVNETQPAGQTHGWDVAVQPAYVRSPEDAQMLREHLAKADTKYGIEAQKSFEWSINNMVDKGSEVPGISGYKSALYDYTGSGYSHVNDTLNSAPPGAKTSSSTVTKIDKGMAASPPLQHDVVLYRGFKAPKSVFGKSGKWNDTNVAGMEWTQRSYSSTSGSLSTAESFGSGGVVMRIIIPKEMNVHGINAKGGQHPGENEIILQRGLRYRVVADYGIKQDSYPYNTRYIDVMVVPNPHAQPEQ